MLRLLIAALAFAVFAAHAQLRTISAEAKRGQIRHLQEMIVEINGKPARLAPGAQIRDASNLIVLPTALRPGSQVKYTLDHEGMVMRVWILTPEEAARPDPKP
jgi:hypothetical protein